MSTLTAPTSPTTSTSHATKKSSFPRVAAWIAIVTGLLLVLGGAATWSMVSLKLADENITVSEDAFAFGGQQVNTPWEAYAEADIISHHALDATGGKTYAELGQDDPLREVAMNGSFLRASLFTSVVSFGVAAFAAGMGALITLLGFALRSLSKN